jgi:hypothetical protein
MNRDDATNSLRSHPRAGSAGVALAFVVLLSACELGSTGRRGRYWSGSTEAAVEVARRIEETVRGSRVGVPVIGDPTPLRIDPEALRVAFHRDLLEVREEP